MKWFATYILLPFAMGAIAGWITTNIRLRRKP